MGITALLALIQAMTTLAPSVEAAIPAIKAILNGDESPDNLAALQAATDAINAQVAQAETNAGA